MLEDTLALAAEVEWYRDFYPGFGVQLLPSALINFNAVASPVLVSPSRPAGHFFISGVNTT